jgi:threonine/homoserine/homoserine lactone efflux protein
MAKRGGPARLSAPKVITFWIAVLLALIGVIADVAPIASLAGYALWLVVAGFVLLALGNLLEGL